MGLYILTKIGYVKHIHTHTPKKQQQQKQSQARAHNCSTQVSPPPSFFSSAPKPPNSAVSTPPLSLKKMRYSKKSKSLNENPMRQKHGESARERRIALYKSNHHHYLSTHSGFILVKFFVNFWCRNVVLKCKHHNIN